MEIPSDMTSVPETETQPAAYSSEDERLEYVRCERLLRDYYDPRSHYVALSYPQVLEWAASMRASPTVDTLGELTGWQVVVAEAVDLGLVHSPQKTFQLPEEEQLRIITGRMQSAQEIAEATRRVVEIEKRTWRVHHQELLEADGQIATLPSDSVLAGKFLGMVGHDGQYRRNGLLFYSHVDEVASLFRMAWRRHFQESADVQLRDDTTVVGYNHDNPEDGMDARGDYLEKDIVITPLVIQKTMEVFGRETAHEIGRAVLLMMRSKGQYMYEPGRDARMPYSQYRERAFTYDGRAGLMTILAKTADSKHNRHIQPNPVPDDPAERAHRLVKNREYDLTLEIAEEEIVRYGLRFAALVGTLKSLTVEDVLEATLAKYQFDPPLIAQQIREQLQIIRQQRIDPTAQVAV